MKITNTHFILGTILFVVIMISLTTSCCDFMPYSRQRGSLGMSVYEGMEDEAAPGTDANEDKDKPIKTEGMEEGATSGTGADEKKEKTKDSDEDNMKKLFESEIMKKKDGFKEKEGFVFGNYGIRSNDTLGGGNMGPGGILGGGDIGNSGSLGGGGGNLGGRGLGSGGWGGGGWGGLTRGSGEYVTVQGITSSGDKLLSVQQRGIRRPRPQSFGLHH